MTKDTLTISGIMVTGLIGLAGLIMQQNGTISELRMEMHDEIGGLRSDMRADISELRTEGRAQSEQIKELQQRMARIEGLLEGMRPDLASATPSS